ncbi:LicD family protein [Aliiglaciecola sp. LCG003]|uniref:LicD family protein n=1 Tax=Aliiglaciecola sp. LCG003 TaxID=3053655 RepID=UPI0025730F83|nr:LicD family protein [Aliiglaciecola sp. LCG003]WJG10580.1 LicD family protein [Aliiglaciecola sp. LCG003]
MKQKIVIFGAGQAGIAANKNLQATYQVVAFCDNDHTKVGSFLEQIPVISPQQLDEIQFDLIMIASEYFEQIRLQLEQQESVPVAKIHILAATQIKPFHFGDSESVKQTAEQILLVLCETLSACGIKYHVDAGTLLGIYRDNALIPWDDDLDFAVPSDCIEIINGHQDRLLAALERVTQQSWKMTQYYATQPFGLVNVGATRSFKLAPINTDRQLPLIDFFVKYLDQDVMDYVIASRGFSMPSRHMHSLDSYTFRGQDVYIPSDVEGYLSSHYGDWQTPKSDWALDDVQSATVFKGL